MHRHPSLFLLLAAGILLLALVVAVFAGSLGDYTLYAPAIHQRDPTPTPLPTPSPTPLPATVEFRGMWVTRFDWTTGTAPADPARIDEIVNDAATAGINALFFQVRANGDAYYAGGLEPWAKRVSGGQLGQPPSPLWDPLATLVQKAHERGIQVHAYLNVYPVWDDCNNPPPLTTPLHIYYLLGQWHGNTEDALQQDSPGHVQCSIYQRATPASVPADDHYLAVAADLVSRYDIDGIHLDNIRYGGVATSCDPVSQAMSGVPCFSTPPNGYRSYEDWQRAQVNGTVGKFYDQIVPLKPGLWLSAAIWPVYIDYWGWSVLEGYYDYYQDAKAWVAGGYIDSISPMIYPSVYNCPDDSFWTQTRWETLINDFQADSAGRYVVAGIGTGYCDFAEIEARINAARAAGTAGHALFSYSGLKSHGYFDDLAAGPYAQPAAVPTIPWHP